MTFQDTIGCPLGSWWNGVQCVIGSPDDVGIKSDGDSSTEEQRWRLFQIPGKTPIFHSIYLYVL